MKEAKYDTNKDDIEIAHIDFAYNNGDLIKNLKGRSWNFFNLSEFMMEYFIRRKEK